jgi:hypothetical protein
MKRLFFILLLVGGCAKESTVGPAKSSTFVRYFNGGNTDEAQAVIETPDGGLILLANTTITGELSTYSKIKVIKTDAYGNQIWQKFYPPDFEVAPPATPTIKITTHYRAKGITINPAGGYVIVGEAINGDLSTGKSELLIFTIDADGVTQKININKSPAPKRIGYGVTATSTGNFLVLSQGGSNSTTNDMILGEYNKTTLDSTWVRSYSAGEIASAPAITSAIPLSNKVYTNSQGAAFWSGTVIKGDVTSRFVKTPPNSPTTEFDLTVGKPGFTEYSNDLIRYGSGFAMVGKTRPTSGGVFNIFFRRLTESGTDVTPTASQVLSLPNNTSPITQTDDAEGNSICVAQDGGLVILGTAKLNVPEGRGETDYVLIKIDAFGTVLWTKSYGSKSADVGKSIITTSDGGHVILGTTEFANVKTLLLMKTDKLGVIP